MENPKVIIATDSFKGSATSKQAGEWISIGAKRYSDNINTKIVPIADGGEGTLEALVEGCYGKTYSLNVSGPLGDTIKAKFAMLDNSTAVIEIAESAGIHLMDKSEKNALAASTYGVGELIIAALDKGAEHIYIGVGGSGTTDGGTGMAKALGVKFLTDKSNRILDGLMGLKDLNKISLEGIDKRIEKTKFTIISDVTNPLTGKEGAISVYGPQKGISPNNVEKYDEYMLNYASILKNTLKRDIGSQKGSGAAGGLGAGLLAFTNAEVTSGIKTVLEIIHFRQYLEDADLVITGEGRIDNQSIYGKAPIGVAKIAKEYDLPVIAIVGSRDKDISKVYKKGVDLVLPILMEPMLLEESIKQTKNNIIETGNTAIRAYYLNQNMKGDK